MKKRILWKVVFTLFVVVMATYLAFPPKEKIKLGLDLKGGMHLVFEVQTNNTEKLAWHLNQTSRNQKGLSGNNKLQIPNYKQITNSFSVAVIATAPVLRSYYEGRKG